MSCFRLRYVRFLWLLVLVGTSLSAKADKILPLGSKSYFKKHPYFKELSELSFEEMDEVYLNGEVPERLPQGYGEGYPYLRDDSGPLNTLAKVIWWGKGFEVDEDNPLEALLYNRFLGIRTLEGRVHVGNFREVLQVPVGQSSYRTLYPGDGRRLYLDDREAVILTYKNSPSPVGRSIKNEVRQIWSDDYEELYLGRSTMAGKFWLHFALKFPKQQRSQ